MTLLIMAPFTSNLLAQYICEGDCVNGYGLKKFKGSKAYMKGKFSEGVLQEGTVTFQNGDVFTGIFKDNFLQEGTKLFHSGKKLEGKFHQNVLTDGVMTETNGVSTRIKLKPLGMVN